MPVRTYQDAVEYLTDHFDVDKTGRIQRNLRRAVDEAYRDLPQQAFWAYYRRRAIINTVASQTTGSIAYSNSTRIVTLSGATFPSNAEKYRLIIGNTHYDIESYTDSTHVVLPSTSNPGADVAAGEEYTLYRNEYSLPTGFRRALGLMDTTYVRPVRMITDAEEQAFQSLFLGTPGVPNAACIRNTGETTGTLSLVFNCPPNAAIKYDLLFDTFPRQFVIAEKYSTGTVSVSSGATAVTGSGTTFPSNCAGCILRLSVDGTSEPTGPYGAKVGSSNIDNQYAFQSVVKSYSSATAVTLADAANAAYSAVKYSLSDPLDIEDGAMFTAFLRMAELAYARQARMDSKVLDRYATEARNALILAKENDVRVTQKQSPVFVDYLPGTITNGDDT